MREQRINEIHRRLRAGRQFNAQTLADEFEVNERTIRRDLCHMRDAKKLPIQFNPVVRTWYYSVRTVELPATIIHAEDRFALLVARQAAEQFLGTPWHGRLVSAYTRLLDTLHHELRTDYQSIAGKIRFEGTPQSPVEPAVWKVLYDSLELQETMSMAYLSGDGGGIRTRRFDPYGLIARNREWYVVGWDHYRQTIRTFYLPRIQSAEYTDKPFSVKGGFHLDSYLSSAVDGHQSNLKPQKIKLRFTIEASAAGRDFVWNRNQRASHDRQGRLVVEFTTGALFAVERHVLSWSGGVEVLSPRKLRAAVCAAAKAVINMSD
jgi:predicted DNA-binding transcriptional regulator YafY